MESVELYKHLLGIESPWFVDNVEMTVDNEQINVFVKHPPNTTFPCVHCQSQCPVYDHTASRTWRHLDTCQFKTLLHASIPRTNCKEHGINQVAVPWANVRSRFTALFETLAINLLLATTRKKAGELLRITWDEVHQIMQSAVKRGLARKESKTPAILGIDEKAIAKGHKYMSIVVDLDTKAVEFVGKGRKKESVAPYFQSMKPEAKKEIRAVSIDMWPAFIGACRDHIPEAKNKIVFDRFHVMQYVLNAVDAVRKKENAAFYKEGRYDLVGSKYVWLTNPENMTDRMKARFEAIQHTEMRTGLAWSMKESLRHWWEMGSVKEGWLYWRQWSRWVNQSDLEPMKKVVKIIRKHLRNILTYFKHKITNGLVESINSKVSTIQKKACGFRNEDNFITAIYFYCGGLSLYPSTHRKV